MARPFGNNVIRPDFNHVDDLSSTTKRLIVLSGPVSTLKRVMYIHV